MRENIGGEKGFEKNVKLPFCVTSRGYNLSMDPPEMPKPPSDHSDPPEDNSLVRRPQNAAAGVYAGFAKSFVLKSIATFSFWAKGFVQWWFRYPIKLFRPATISPYYMFNAMAQREGKPMSLQYMKNVLSDEGVFEILFIC